MEMNKLELNVFELRTLDYLGVINNFTSLSWTARYKGYGEFELWAPVTQENLDLINKNNIIWKGDNSAMLIEIVKINNSNGKPTINAKGRSLEALLDQRILLGTITSFLNQTKTQFTAYMINVNCITVRTDRIVPFLKMGNIVRSTNAEKIQRTGKSIYDNVIDILSYDNMLGFDISFDNKEQAFEFNIFNCIDRTDINSNEYVELNTDLDDVLTSDYVNDVSNEANVAFTYGEGSGVDRKNIEYSSKSYSGFDRKEIYVDAKDLQSTYTDVNGNQQVMTDTEYLEALKARSIQKLNDQLAIETFEATIRMSDFSQYVYGVDYSLGDKIVIKDNNLSISVNAQITECTETFGKSYNKELTFGFTQSTVSQKIRALQKDIN